jgi:hypothetical protein
LDQLYDKDEDDTSSTTSILADGQDLNIETRQCLTEQPTALKHHSRFERTVLETISPPSNSRELESKTSLLSRTHCDPVPIEEIKSVKRRPLILLDLPVDSPGDHQIGMRFNTNLLWSDLMLTVYL